MTEDKLASMVAFTLVICGLALMIGATLKLLMWMF